MKKISKIIVLCILISYYEVSAQPMKCRFGIRVKSLYSGKNNKNICNKGDTIEEAYIYNRFQHNLEKIAKDYKPIHVIFVRKRKLLFPINVPVDFVKNQQLKSFYLDKIKSDTIFKHIKSINRLDYLIKDFNKDVFKCDSLAHLFVLFKNGNIKQLTNKDNYNLLSLSLYSKKSEIIDSTLLHFKNLKLISFNFNPFQENQTKIIQSLDSLKVIFVGDFNFNNFEIKEEYLKPLVKYKIHFIGCKFTNEQKKLIKMYRNIKII